MTGSASYSCGTSSSPLLGETIDANLRRSVARFPDREAVVDVPAGRRMTYTEVDAAVDELARGLLARGVAPADRVGIWAPNCVEWYLVQFATARIGAILVNINPAYRTHELLYVLNQATVGTLVATPAFRTSDYRAMIDEVRPEVASLRDVFYLGEQSWAELLSGAADVPGESVAERAAQL